MLQGSCKDSTDEGCRAKHMPSHRDIIQVIVTVIRIRMPKALNRACNGFDVLKGVEGDCGVALHLGDKSRGLAS